MKLQGWGAPICRQDGGGALLFWQVQRACDGEGGFGFGFGVLGLGAADGEGVFAGEDLAVALVVNTGERAGIEGDGDFAGGSGGDADTLESRKGVDRAVFLRGLEV